MKAKLLCVAALLCMGVTNVANAATFYSLTSLPSLGGKWSFAYGINNAGQVVGYSFTSDNSTHATLWNGGAPIDLGTLPGGTSSFAHAINNGGQIVGYTAGGGNPTATLWNGGAPANLGSTSSVANAINNAGQIVGQNNIGGGGNAALWNGGAVIGLPPGHGTANGINNAGQVVGSSGASCCTGPQPTLWNGTTAVVLPSSQLEAKYDSTPYVTRQQACLSLTWDGLRSGCKP